MKMRASKWFWFALLVVAQCVVPAMRIVKFETVLRKGVPYRFRCRPVDPFDAFRGRYVRVFPELGSVVWRGEKLRRGATVYVALRQGCDGFAEPTEATLTPPPSGDYIAGYHLWSATDDTIRVELPFDRYYMPENLALHAEKAYREGVSGSNAWLVVRVKDGAGVIENLYVNGRPVAEVAREMLNKR